MKKILCLGGSTQQIPAIEYANKKGYYTVLCDYIWDNPGQYYSDKFFCVSTTDKKAILEVAMQEKVDGIVAYASDPAAPTAAYVAEKLGLPTNPYKSVEILAYKDKFRNFLRGNGFNCPKAKSYSSLENANDEIGQFTFPVMVKPIDSSGSKGVKKVESLDEFEEAFNKAMAQSRSKNVIIEEYLTRDHNYIIGGDCFVQNGKTAFMGLLNCHRDKNVNPLVPVGKSFPVQISKYRIEQIRSEIQRIVDLLDIKFGGFNLEIIFDRNGKMYLIEMGPRNGGNMIPDLLKIVTGIDLIAAAVETAMGNNVVEFNYKKHEAYYATYNLHACKSGVFTGIEFDDKVKSKIIKQVIYKKAGDPVEYFDAANKAIGIVFFKFDSVNEMLDIMDNSEKWINVKVE
jgi:biotin carboxylase